MNLLPIPWMKLKLESIYNVNLYGNLYLIFNDISNNYNIDTNSLSNLLVDHNILVDDSHPLYLYLPMELNDQIYKLMTSFKYLYKDNIYIINLLSENDNHNLGGREVFPLFQVPFIFYFHVVFTYWKLSLYLVILDIIFKNIHYKCY